MKIFVSYKFNGEDKRVLKDKLTRLTIIFEKFGHKTFLFSRDLGNWGANNYTNQQIITLAFTELVKCDLVFALVDNQEKSEGMLLELGYALANHIPIWLAINSGLDKECLRFIRALSVKTFVFSDQTMLCNQLTDELKGKSMLGK